jgi:hypothetical protein
VKEGGRNRGEEMEKSREGGGGKCKGK